ncbi:TetR/AcrR family transcriptional regulator [Psychrobacillus sp. FJAT-21963]|uniref:TetR/AcrR family transcriptional regulator n=1 Tax=Psychrobacillus sp. FJAT-21963 TaxID=1712028 RepID=UPI0006F676D7|nr:TetR/AcrR family transcriptional regulator [Psychrobacillus sp. FJAT-21963]
MKPVDPRVKRTKRLLTDAMMKLMVEEGYEAITIREIVKIAEVNRSTFYLHFRDKQDMLEQMQDEILKEFEETFLFPTYTYESALHDYKKFSQPIKILITMFEHIQKHESFYRIMLSEREFHDRVTLVIKDEVLRFQDSVWEATFMANGSIGLILNWLEGGMKESIEEISLWLTRVILFPLADFK